MAFGVAIRLGGQSRIAQGQENIMTVATSLVIITLNRPKLLAQTLEGLMRQTLPLAEVIIIDNGPHKETEEVVTSFSGRLPIRYVPEPRRGYGRARNRGLSEMKGEILYFLDDDCVAERNWAETLFNVVKSGKADLACGSRVVGHSGVAPRVEYLSTDGPALSPKLSAGKRHHLSTCNLVFSRKVVDKVGQFDETLAMCEDRDFTVRAAQAGFRLHFEPKAQVIHYSGVTSMKIYLRRMRHYGFGTSQFFASRPAESLARFFPTNPFIRLLSIPFLAAAGTGYLVLKNLSNGWDCLLLSPAIYLGQFWWQWGGYEAMQAIHSTQASTAAATAR
jgi:GT2 family glycosyltransferase